ncbi:MAG: hypothetical protein ACO3RP_05515 [Flavobacteriaceae bacterium]|jgi:cupin superfamily acireductone dioxygenase involved in methionine salvage
MNRIKLFDENVSPNQKRLRLMELSGIKLSESQKKKLKPRTESVSKDDDFDEVDLDEILKEMGYSEDDYSDIPDREDWIDMVGIRKGELKELIRQMVREYFDETFENPDELDLNQIIENLTIQ